MTYTCTMRFTNLQPDDASIPLQVMMLRDSYFYKRGAGGMRLKKGEVLTQSPDAELAAESSPDEKFGLWTDQELRDLMGLGWAFRYDPTWYEDAIAEQYAMGGYDGR